MSIPAAQRVSTPPPRLDLSPGLPDLSAFPRAAWLRAERAALNDLDPRDLGYGDPKGHPQLRQALAERLARLRGVRTDPDHIVVVAGVAQGLALLTRVLPHHGTRQWAMENPGSAGIREHLAAWDCRPRPIPVDTNGIDVSALTASNADTVVVTPAHQFPTGVVLAGHRRTALLEWARAGGLIIEDDYDAEHRYDRPPTTALQPRLPDSIVYLGSVSKTLSPTLRLGWLVAPPHLLRDLVAAKHAFDIAAPGLAQLTLANMIANGTLDRLSRSIRRRQRQRRDALVAALHHYLPDAEIHGIPAGLHLLITSPTLTDDAALAATLNDRGVTVHPLSMHHTGPHRPGIILGYASSTPTQLTDAAQRISRALTQLRNNPMPRTRTDDDGVGPNASDISIDTVKDSPTTTPAKHTQPPRVEPAGREPAGRG